MSCLFFGTESYCMEMSYLLIHKSIQWNSWKRDSSLSLVGLKTDNLAANFSRELADYIIYIIDVSAGDKIPRKGGPGITQADLLVCALLY